MQNFGPIIHAVYLKAAGDRLVLSKIDAVCRCFYDKKLLKHEATDD
jgi:hypothetical protein